MIIFLYVYDMQCPQQYRDLEFEKVQCTIKRLLMKALLNNYPKEELEEYEIIIYHKIEQKIKELGGYNRKSIQKGSYEYKHLKAYLNALSDYQIPRGENVMGHIPIGILYQYFFDGLFPYWVHDFTTLDDRYEYDIKELDEMVHFKQQAHIGRFLQWRTCMHQEFGIHKQNVIFIPKNVMFFKFNGASKELFLPVYLYTSTVKFYNNLVFELLQPLRC